MLDLVFHANAERVLWLYSCVMATVEDVRRIAMSLPRTTEHLIRDHTKFRVGRLVYASVSPDSERLGSASRRKSAPRWSPATPGKFMMPLRSDERYHWVRARLPFWTRTNYVSCSSTPGAW